MGDVCQQFDVGIVNDNAGNINSCWFIQSLVGLLRRIYHDFLRRGLRWWSWLYVVGVACLVSDLLRGPDIVVKFGQLVGEWAVVGLVRVGAFWAEVW